MRNVVSVSAITLFLSVILLACGGGTVNNQQPEIGETPVCENPETFQGYEGPGVEVLSGVINQDYTLASKCYLVNQQISVRNNATLYINPRTTIIFTETGSLTANGGAIIAQGNASSPIYFTGEIKQPGSWPGIRILQSGNRSNIFEYVVIEYAGNRFANNVTQPLFSFGVVNVSNIDTGGRLTFSNNVIRKSGGKYAFYADEKSFFDKIRNNVFYDNSEYPVHMHNNEVHLFDATNRLSFNGIGNGNNKIYVSGNIINTFDAPEAKFSPNISWYNLGVPYLISEDVILIETNLELQAGTQLQFKSNTGLVVTGPSASLMIKGTANNRVRLSLEDEFIVPNGGQQSAYWDGLRFDEATNVKNTIEHAIIEYAGVTSTTGRDPANLIILDNSRVNVSNTTLRNSSGYGLLLTSDARLPTFTANTITRNQLGAVKASSRAVRFLDDTSDYTGNSLDWVEVSQGGISGGEVWSGLNVPYAFLRNEHFIIDGRLTIEQGATLIFDEAVKLEVSSSGSLNATGTLAAPVIFTSVSQYFGGGFGIAYWQGIYFKGSEGRLENVDISYAGLNSGLPNTQASAVTVSSPNASRAQLTINNVSIYNNYPTTVWGIFVDDNSTLLQENTNIDFQICNQATGFC